MFFTSLSAGNKNKSALEKRAPGGKLSNICWALPPSSQDTTLPLLQSWLCQTHKRHRNIEPSPFSCGGDKKSAKLKSIPFPAHLGICFPSHLRNRIKLLCPDDEIVSLGMRVAVVPPWPWQDRSMVLQVKGQLRCRRQLRCSNYDQAET